MKSLLLVLAMVFILCAQVGAQSPTEMKLYEQLSTPGKKSVVALETVLTAPETFSPTILFIAAKTAFENKRLEDSGFLFYAAQLRMRFDEQCFPATGVGGDSPFVFYGALSQELGSVINPTVMDEPVVFAKVLERLTAWQPKADKNYDPGYEHSPRLTEKQALKASAANRREFEKGMGDLSTLLEDADYLAASRIVRTYNEFGENQPAQAAYDKAIDTMVRIEKQKGLRGFMAE